MSVPMMMPTDFVNASSRLGWVAGSVVTETPGHHDPLAVLHWQGQSTERAVRGGHDHDADVERERSGRPVEPTGVPQMRVDYLGCWRGQAQLG